MLHTTRRQAVRCNALPQAHTHTCASVCQSECVCHLSVNIRTRSSPTAHTRFHIHSQPQIAPPPHLAVNGAGVAIADGWKTLCSLSLSPCISSLSLYLVHSLWWPKDRTIRPKDQLLRFDCEFFWHFCTFFKGLLRFALLWFWLCFWRQPVDIFIFHFPYFPSRQSAIECFEMS